MSPELIKEVGTFISAYSDLFTSPSCSDSELCAEVARKVGQHYRLGVTFFTGGKISRFETQEEAAKLIETEMRKNVTLKLGTHLKLLHIQKIESYSSTSALCWLEWQFVLQKGSEHEGKGWKFTNVYGYRAASEGLAAGWEFVLRDEEVESMFAATGMRFDDYHSPPLQMEAVGLSLGLFGILHNVVEDIRYIQLARDFDDDFKTGTIRLRWAEVRLTRLSLALVECKTEINEASIAIAERDVQQISTLVEKARRKSQSYEGEAGSATSPQNAQPKTFEERQVAEATKDLCKRNGKKLAERLKRLSVPQPIKKAFWAVLDKTAFEEMIGDIEKLLTTLEDAVPGARATLQQLAKEEMGNLSVDIGNLIQDILSKHSDAVDRLFKDALDDKKVEADLRRQGVQQTNHFSGTNNGGMVAGYQAGPIYFSPK
ncbi:hypothetical protein KC354_g600 [Hortaea werneckii]|nr:hypothetical protein KC354_g600 [Hortaea werneckii]